MTNSSAPFSGINHAIAYCACRTQTEFSNVFQSKTKRGGTGFWVSFSGKPTFITNRHNLDPDLAIGLYSGYILERFWIELRRIPQGTPTADTAFLEVENLQDCVHLSDTGDCAILAQPKFVNAQSEFVPVTIDSSAIASQEWLEKNLHLMDLASFVGFPGGNGQPWWDEAWNAPIARMVNIASMPHRPFINSSIHTGDVTLVSGLSFSGSSGSPVISHAKPQTPPKVIGIMSGHWQEEDKSPAITKHSGLSYFTRSTSIWETIKKITA